MLPGVVTGSLVIVPGGRRVLGVVVTAGGMHRSSSCRGRRSRGCRGYVNTGSGDGGGWS